MNLKDVNIFFGIKTSAYYSSTNDGHVKLLKGAESGERCVVWALEVAALGSKIRKKTFPGKTGYFLNAFTFNSQSQFMEINTSHLEMRKLRLRQFKKSV